MDEATDRIIAIMQELGISYYQIETSIGEQNGVPVLFDELRVHFADTPLGETEPHLTATANEFNQPTFGLLKELERLTMGEES